MSTQEFCKRDAKTFKPFEKPPEMSLLDDRHIETLRVILHRLIGDRNRNPRLMLNGDLAFSVEVSFEQFAIENHDGLKECDGLIDRLIESTDFDSGLHD